jgi:hypothetical protein
MFNIHINNTNNQANSENIGVSLFALYQHYLQHPKRLYNIFISGIVPNKIINCISKVTNK